MSVSVVESHAATNRLGRGTLTAIGLAMLGAVGFVILAALPYFTFLYSDAPNQFVDEARFGAYFPRRGWLLLHIAGGMLAVLAGPVQLWLGLSDRRMDVHRRLGLTYIAGVTVGAIGAVALAVQTPFGWVFGAGLLSLAAAWVITTGLAIPILDEILVAKFNQKIIFNPVSTADPVSCKSKFLDSPQAWKGTLVRTAGRWQAETMKAWGANPTVINLGDLYTALQRGTADCALLVYNLLDSFRIYEVAKYITRIDHSINYQVVTVNLDVWQKLGPQAQRVFLEAGEQAKKKSLELRKDLTVNIIAKFKGQGVRFCTPSTEELTRLRDATNQVWDQIKKEQGEAGRRIMAIATRYRDKVVTGPVEGDRTPCSGR